MNISTNTVGLGLRRDMLSELELNKKVDVDFWEIAPENWLKLGGRYQNSLKQITGQYPFMTHGLSLSIGGPDELDVEFVKEIKAFLDEYNIQYYSEHLSYCSGNGHLYDLLPIPFTESAIDYVVERIQRVQDILKRQLILENVSYYAAPAQQLSESDFICEVLTRADCKLLLDINNIHVNSVNHRYDAKSFLQSMPTARIAYMHIAGHYNEAEDLIVDTHGADVIEPVWQLLELAYNTHGVHPTLLERDFNIPPLAELLKEVQRIRQIQQHCMPTKPARDVQYA